MQVQLNHSVKNIDFIDFGNLEVGNLDYVLMKLGSLLSMTCRHHLVELWNSTVNRYKWIPRAGSLKLC